MKLINKIFRAADSRKSRAIRNILVRYFRIKAGNMPFCIFSNDCWGAEIYKVLDKPFNTPFIGLMLMSPCYIKLLENPKYYLELQLVFKSRSNYPSMQKLNAGIDFPLATLGNSDIEIHFLHFKSKETANEKWNRRVKRIDWNNLSVKFDCGKDYANEESVEKFLNLPYANKLIFGREDFEQKEVKVLEKYSFDAVVQFRNCFLNFNPIGWIKDEKEYKNKFQKYAGKIAYKYL